MELATLLRQINTNIGELLKFLEQIFRDGSVEKWLQLGEALCTCLSEETEKKHGELDGAVVVKYLTVLNAIIPPLPDLLENEFDKKSKFLKRCPKPSSNAIFVDKLISKIIKPVFAIPYQCNSFFSLPLLPIVFLKTIFHASKETIMENDDVFSEEFFNFMERHLEPCCHEVCHIFMALLFILATKMPAAWFEQFLKPKIIFKMRLIVTRYDEKMCPIANHLKELYCRLNLENMLARKVSTWLPLLNMPDMLEGQNIALELRYISHVINEEEMDIQQFLQSGVFSKLKFLLSHSDEVGQTPLGIKTFLTVFLNFKTDIDYHFMWNSNVFEKLVRLVVRSLDFLVVTVDKMLCMGQKHNGDALLAIRRFQKDISVTLGLMQCLYVLNGSWHQWFDIVDSHKIIDNEVFLSQTLSEMFESELNDETTKLKWFISVTKMCPAFVSYKTRLNMFNSILPNQTFDQSFGISRDSVLQDVMKIFHEKKSFMSSKWNFTFKNEIGRGAGVTKEVYSLITRELQRHDLELWQGEPTKRSSDEATLYTYSPRGLLPKVNSGLSDLTNIHGAMLFLGQLMAKALLDGYLLDIPLNDELFRILKRDRYSHLRRDYFDLPQAFPILESIFKQLISVKRKIETIRLNDNYTEHEKQRLINDLTFDDGSSFEDLYLNFTVPGTEIELIENGRDVILSIHNMEIYLDKLCNYKFRLDPINQYSDIRVEFEQVLFALLAVDLFYPNELRNLICCEHFQKWAVEDLRKFCIYTDSQSVQYLFECLASFDFEEQQLFLSFATSLTALPIGGLCNLDPPLTISKIHRDNVDSSLPSAATCNNIFYLPEYSSLEVTKKNVLYAIREGIRTFQFA